MAALSALTLGLTTSSVVSAQGISPNPGDSIRSGVSAAPPSSEGTSIEDFDQSPDALHVSGGAPGAPPAVSDSGSAGSASAPSAPAAAAAVAPAAASASDAASSASSSNSPAASLPMTTVPASEGSTAAAAPGITPAEAPTVSEAPPSVASTPVAEVRIEPGASTLPPPPSAVPSPVEPPQAAIPIAALHQSNRLGSPRASRSCSATNTDGVGIGCPGAGVITRRALPIAAAPVIQPAPSPVESAPIPLAPAVAVAPPPIPMSQGGCSGAGASPAVPLPMAAAPVIQPAPSAAASPYVAAEASAEATPASAGWTPPTSAAAPAIVATAPAPAVSAPPAPIPAAVASAPVVDKPVAAAAVTVPKTSASQGSMDQTRTSARGSGKSKREPAAKEEVAAKEPGTNGFSDLQFASGEPIKITGDTFSFHNNERYVVWSGHVRVNNATSQVTSNTVRLNFGKDLNDIQEILADGNVRISQGTRWATGDQAILNQNKHTVTLTGPPVVPDGQEQIAGTKITVHRHESERCRKRARDHFPASEQAVRGRFRRGT